MNLSNIKNTLRFLAVAASPLALIFAAGPGTAWADDSTKSQPDSSALEEIVVTAQLRSQSLSNVPISVEAYTSEQLERQAVTDTRDLASLSPMVNFSTGNSGNATSFSLRGVSSTTSQLGLQPSTAMVLDGVGVVRQAEFISHLGDIDRIEVLNGPQGTLFGKNSTAGVINIVTKAPTDKDEGLIEASETTDQETNVRAMVNFVVTDAIRLRVNAFYGNQKGFVRNLSGPDVLGDRSSGINVKVAMDLAPRTTLLLNGTVSYSNSSAGQDFAVNPPIFAQQFAALGGISGYGKLETNVNQPVADMLKTEKITATLNHQVSDNLSFVSISNYSWFSEESSIDSNMLPNGAYAGQSVQPPTAGYPFEQPFVGYPRFPDDFTYYTEELRATYQSGPIDLILGSYYQHMNEANALRLPFVLDGSLLGLTPGTLYYTSSETHASVADTTASAFADVTYTLTNQFKAFAGIRYTFEQFTVRYHRDNFFGPYSDYNPVTAVFSLPAETDPAVIGENNKYSRHNNSNVSGRAGLQWEPMSNLNFYGSYARGYKGPAEDNSQALGEPPNQNKDPITKPEIANSFEIGGKTRLFGNRVSLNVAIFYETINDIQEGVITSGASLTPNLINAGKLKTRGVEAESQWLVTPQVRFNAAVDFDKATYAGFNYLCNPTQFATNTCPNQGGPGLQNITGQPAVGSPEWKYSVGPEYRNNLTGTGVSYYGRADYTWTGPIMYQLGNDPLDLAPGHGLLSASAGLDGSNDRWQVQLFGKNLLNKFYYSGLEDFSTLGQPIGFLPRDVHRYVGVKFTARF
jgi:iron complex outermembrane receptor protein